MIIRTKILAVLLGTVGIGVFSLVQNTLGLLLGILPIGTNGLTKYVSEYFHKKRNEEINYLVKIILLHNLPLIIILSVVLMIFPDKLSEILLSNDSYWVLFIILAFILPFGLVSNILETYAKSIRHINLYVKVSILNVLISIVIFIPFVIYLGIDGALISSGISFITGILLYILYLKKNNVLPELRKTKTVENVIVKRIYGMGFAMVVMIVTQQVAFLLIRTIIANNLGIDNLGIYQSAYSISTNFFGLFYSTIVSYAIPKLSATSDNENITIEINRILKLFIFLYTPIIVFSFVFRQLLITFLYSKDFYDASNIILFQLLGEFFKAISWIIGLWFVPTAIRIKQWLIFEVINNIFYVSLCYLFINNTTVGLKAIPISYLISYIIFVMLNIYYVKKVIKFKFLFRNFYFVVISIFFIASIFLISQVNMLYGYYFVLPILVLWFFMSINKNDIRQINLFIKDLVRIKINTGY